MPEWGIAIISMVVGFLLNFLYENYKERKKTRKESLRTHFDEIERRIIMKLSEVSGNLAIIKDRLLFGSFAPVTEHHPLLDNENYLSFEIHFPELAYEWKELKNEALILKGYVDIVARGASANSEAEYEEAKRHINDDLFPLQEKFADFAIRLSEKAKDIEQYQIGTVFKYNKKCPICKKF